MLRIALLTAALALCALDVQASGHISQGAENFPVQAQPPVLPPTNPASPSRDPRLVPGTGAAGHGSNPALRGPIGTPGAGNFPNPLPC